MIEKSPHVMLPYEKLIPDHVYTFSINPNNHNQRFYTEYTQNELNAVTRLALFKANIVKKLNDIFKDTADYKADIEVSSGGRLHLHGVIRIHDKKQFYLICIDRLKHMCTYELDTIKDQDVWEKYCTKQEGDFGSIDIVGYGYINEIVYKDEPKEFHLERRKKKSVKL